MLKNAVKVSLTHFIINNVILHNYFKPFTCLVSNICSLDHTYVYDDKQTLLFRAPYISGDFDGPLQMI